MSTICDACPIMRNDVVESIRLIDTNIRMCMTTIFVYLLIMAATMGIIVFIAQNMWTLYNQWRMMAMTASPPIDSFMSSSTAIGLGDNEVYRTEMPGSKANKNPPPVGEMIDQSMSALEDKYAKYNKQIADYSINVLKKKETEDVFDRSVLDRGQDDWS